MVGPVRGIRRGWYSSSSRLRGFAGDGGRPRSRQDRNPGTGTHKIPLETGCVESGSQREYDFRPVGGKLSPSVSTRSGDGHNINNPPFEDEKTTTTERQRARSLQQQQKKNAQNESLVGTRRLGWRMSFVLFVIRAVTPNKNKSKQKLLQKKKQKQNYYTRFISRHTTTIGVVQGFLVGVLRNRTDVPNGAAVDTAYLRRTAYCSGDRLVAVRDKFKAHHRTKKKNN